MFVLLPVHQRVLVCGEFKFGCWGLNYWLEEKEDWPY